MSDFDIRMPFDNDSAIDRYRFALGAFINDFTVMETFMFYLLCAAAKVTRPIGQALFSGARAEDMTKLIRRCFEARGKEIEPWLDRALSQVTVLSGARNQVVHFTTLGIEDNETEVWASNQFRHPPRTAKELRLTPEDLCAMAKDARILIAYLTTATEELKKPGSMPNIIAEMRVSKLPWHYKSPQPASPDRKSRGTPPTRTRPLRS